MDKGVFWQAIPGFDNYEVNYYGQVRSVNREVISKSRSGKRVLRNIKSKLLKPWKTPNGRPFVILYKGKARHNRLIHTIVYESFIGPVEKGIIKHHDGNLDNNELRNLYLSSHSQNIRKANQGRLRGIERYKKTDKWMVRFAVHGERVFFGTYNSKNEAYRKFHQFYKNIFQEEPFDLGLLEESFYGGEDSPP